MEVFKIFNAWSRLLLRWRNGLFVPGLLLALVVVLPVRAQSLGDQRQNFLAAERAFAKGQIATYRRLAAGLTDYPLYPYLRYNRLRRNISLVNYAQIDQFLQEYSGVPVAGLLRNRWLNKLAAAKDWPRYRQVYRPSSSVDLQCYYNRALLAGGSSELAWQGARKLWLYGKSRPRACDPLFAAWQQSGDFSTDLVWQRLRLALKAGRPGLANYLRKKLPVAEQKIAQQLVDIHRNPRQTLNCNLWKNPDLAGVAAHGLRRLARKDAALALAVWQAREPGAQLNTDDRFATLNRLALELALAGDPNAEEFLAELPLEVLDETLGEWRLRWALSQRKWQRLAGWYEQLDELPKESTRWRYWNARALQAGGDRAEASSIFSELATQRDYYGFLAADQLGLPYQFQQQEPVADDVDLTALIALPTIKRVIELRQFGRETDARREWWSALSGATREQKITAAKLAQSWEWHSVAVLTAASAKSWNDLRLRFPVVYSPFVEQQAEVQKLPAELVLGLIRRESIFDATARSRVGARGLMQLMPGTAKRVARSRGERWRSASHLTRPELNIRYGTHYLRQMLDRFDGNNALALAAYNGGPNNVDRWLRRWGSSSADIWTELITFGETRDYVQAVLSYALIYRQLSGERPVRLSALAPIVNVSAPALSPVVLAPAGAATPRATVSHCP